MGLTTWGASVQLSTQYRVPCAGYTVHAQAPSLGTAQFAAKDSAAGDNWANDTRYLQDFKWLARQRPCIAACSDQMGVTCSRRRGPDVSTSEEVRSTASLRVFAVDHEAAGRARELVAKTTPFVPQRVAAAFAAGHFTSSDGTVTFPREPQQRCAALLLVRNELLHFSLFFRQPKSKLPSRTRRASGRLRPPIRRLPVAAADDRQRN